MGWQIDQVHTHVGFSVKHMMVSTVRGQFKSYSGRIEIDPADFQKSQIEGEVDVLSIDTGVQQRDDHLRTSDFFDAPHHPKLTFKSTKIDAKGDGEFVVHGDLTMRGVTKNVAFDVEFRGTNKNPWGKTVTGLSASTTVNRKDWGISYNAALEAGGVLIGEKVKIELELEAALEN